MNTTKTRTILALALCATGFLGTVQAKDTRVLWIIDGNQTAIHRFNVTNVGEADETWTETEPLMTFSSMTVCNLIPAHGGYYLCKGDGSVHRYDKNGTWIRTVGQLSGCTGFEISGDQAYIYGSDMNSGAGHNKISALHLGFGDVSVFVTNNIEEAVYLADRILILGNCPTYIQHEFSVNLPRPRDYISPEFMRLRQQISAVIERTR